MLISSAAWLILIALPWLTGVPPVGWGPYGSLIWLAAIVLTTLLSTAALSGTGFAYFPTPPPANTSIGTASGDQGKPERELGDGWWWVA